MSLEAFLLRFGVPALYAGSVIEGETFAIIGGALAHRGIFSLPVALVAVAAGTFTADQAAYWLGRSADRLRPVQKITSSAAFAKASALLKVHPKLFVFTVRFAYGMRTAGAMAIGASGFHWPLYVLLDLCAIAVWVVLFVSLGYAFAYTLDRLTSDVAHAEKLIALIVVGAALFALGRTALRRRADASK